MSTNPLKIMFTEKETASYIGMSRGFLRQDRMHGTRTNRTPGPHYIKIGRSIRYLQTDLDQWILQHKIQRN